MRTYPKDYKGAFGRKTRSRLTLAAALSVLCGTAMAQTIWTGGEDNSWTNANNWTAGVPGATDQAVFAEAGADFLTEINIPAGARSVHSLLFNNNNAGNISITGSATGSSDSLTFGSGGGVTVDSGVGNVLIDLGNSSARYFLQATGVTTIENNSAGSTLTFANDFRRVSGTPQVSVRGTGDIVVNRNLGATSGAWTLDADFTGRLVAEGPIDSNSATTVNGGTLVLEHRRGARTSSSAGLIVNNGTLMGVNTATVGDPRIGWIGTFAGDNQLENYFLDVDFNDGAIIDPGLVAGGIGTLEFTNFDVNFNEGSTLRLDLQNKNAHDSLKFSEEHRRPDLILAAGGDGVTLALNLLPDFSADIDDVFTILDGYSALTGTFAGLADQSVFQQGDVFFRIDYGADATTLTVIPEPSTLLLFGIFGFACLLLSRFRSRP